MTACQLEDRCLRHRALFGHLHWELRCPVRDIISFCVRGAAWVSLTGCKLEDRCLQLLGARGSSPSSCRGSFTGLMPNASWQRSQAAACLELQHAWHGACHGRPKVCLAWNMPWQQSSTQDADGNAKQSAARRAASILLAVIRRHRLTRIPTSAAAGVRRRTRRAMALCSFALTAAGTDAAGGASPPGMEHAMADGGMEHAIGACGVPLPMPLPVSSESRPGGGPGGGSGHLLAGLMPNPSSHGALTEWVADRSCLWPGRQRCAWRQTSASGCAKRCMIVSDDLDVKRRRAAAQNMAYGGGSMASRARRWSRAVAHRLLAVGVLLEELLDERLTHHLAGQVGARN